MSIVCHGIATTRCALPDACRRTGTLTVTEHGETARIPVSGPPKMRQLVSNNISQGDHIEVARSPGLQAYSFTYG